MSKKLKDLKWKSVALEGFPASLGDKFQGFIGLEECTSYDFDDGTRNKKTQKKKRKSNDELQEIPTKKPKPNKDRAKTLKPVKLSNGFVVESCNTATPSLTNEAKAENKINRNKIDKNYNKEVQKGVKNSSQKNEVKQDVKKKTKLGEDIMGGKSDLTAEDMLTWAEFKLQEPLMKALTELGFKKPTKIQQMSLPAAIHGRRDILGAAETGSGKTLAFGLPILSGILKLKEKAELKGLDVYDIPYKKTSHKKKPEKPELVIKNNKSKVKNKDKKNAHQQKAKESSEDGYGTDDESNDSEDDEKTVNSNNESAEETKSNKLVKAKAIGMKKMNKKKQDDDFIKEIEVPIKKRVSSVDEGNDSDDSNYVHLSEMLDSDDLAKTSDEETDTAEKSTSESEIESFEDGNDETIESDNDDVEKDSETESIEDNNETSMASDKDEDELLKDDASEGIESADEEIEDEVSEETIDENIRGIGCVKVIDNIEIPGPVSTKTGKPLYALILTPTRELAIQISRHLIAVARYTGIRVATIVGGMAAVKQERVLRSGPEVVVATPGRLWELVTQGQTHLQQLDTVKFLAIDETDRMIERGHFEELQPLLERLNVDEEKRSTRQNFVFSATLTMVHELPTHMKGKKVTKRGKIINRKIDKMTPQQKIKRLVDMIGMTEPKVVDITAQNLGTAETLTECRIACALEHKDAYLYYILKRHPGRTIVFCNSIGSVKRLAQLFTLLKCRPLPLHASMPQRQRLKNLERFRDDHHGVLIATDVAARGLDIPDVDHVIHYQVPRTAENYVHRSGRTARANKEGLTILMMEPSEAYLYAKLCRTLNKTSEVPTFPVPPQSLSPLKDLVSIARDLDSLMLKRRRAAQALGWREKAAREMDMIIDDDDLPVKEVDSSIDKAVSTKKRQLESLLNRPLFPKGFSFKYPTLNDPNMLKTTEENALQVMKKALESGELKKQKRKSKNASLLKLQKMK